MSLPPIDLSFDGPLATAARQGVLNLATSRIPSEQRMDALVDQLCRKIDEHWNPRTKRGEKRADFLIYEVLPVFVRFFAQRLFDEMRQAGEV